MVCADITAYWMDASSSKQLMDARRFHRISFSRVRCEHMPSHPHTHASVSGGQVSTPPREWDGRWLLITARYLQRVAYYSTDYSTWTLYRYYSRNAAAQAITCAMRSYQLIVHLLQPSSCSCCRLRLRLRCHRRRLSERARHTGIGTCVDITHPGNDLEGCVSLNCHPEQRCPLPAP
jgi:hypothetical protein